MDMHVPPEKKPRLGVDVSIDKDSDKLHSQSETQESTCLSEVDVGIKCFITSGFEPIPGILKQRFSDFVVNEIDMSNKVVELRSLTVDSAHLSPIEVESQEVNNAESGSNETQASGDIPIPPEKLDELKQLVESLDGKPVKLIAPSDKESRRIMHLYIKKEFPKLCSNCVEADGIKYLEVKRSSDSRNKNGKNKESWPKKCPPYCHFVLYKEFKDTIEAIDIISKYSNIKAHMFSYAGTKDRRAKTSQRVCVHKVLAEKLLQVNAKLHGICMGNFTYSNERISLGQLLGNSFKIVIRNVSTNEENLKRACQEISEKGFINYFGMQRFGTTSVPTYEVGKYLLKGELDKALDLIMMPRDSDKPDLRSLRQVWIEKRDAEAVLASLPKSCNIERRLMQGVVRAGCKNLHSVFESIPRQMRQLYLHSYQSLIWNRLVTKRIEKHGLRVLAGDLVYSEKDPISNDVDEMDEASPDDSISKAKSSVKILCEDDLPNYMITDVLVPLPGYKIELPENEMKGWYEEMLAGDDLTISSLKTKHKDYQLPGSYRNILVTPANIASSLAYYDDVKEELVLSDMDIINKKVLVVKECGKFQAAILEFSLPASSYATMMLRELMRIDTSANHQSSLNKT